MNHFDPLPMKVLAKKIVHIVSDDDPVCDGISTVFRLEGFHTAVSKASSQFLSAIADTRPDVIIVNLSLGGDEALSLLRLSRTLHAGVSVFMLVEPEQVAAAVTAMKLGASDVLTKPVDPERLVQAVRNAIRQNIRLVDTHNGQKCIEVLGFAQLTPREREVLQAIVSGLSNKQTALDLGISPRTVEVHRAKIMSKLGAKNTADLTRIVLTS